MSILFRLAFGVLSLATVLIFQLFVLSRGRSLQVFAGASMALVIASLAAALLNILVSRCPQCHTRPWNGPWLSNRCHSCGYDSLPSSVLTPFRVSHNSLNVRAENYEGAWVPNFLVVLEFPSRQAVRDFYDSEDYQPLKILRQQAAHSNGIIVTDRLAELPGYRPLDNDGVGVIANRS